MLCFPKIFSQTRYVRKRKAAGLHPVSEMQRFYILVCCFFCSVCVSLTYAFDLFTSDFQKQFGLSAGDLSTVSTVGLVFCYFTIPYSAIFENLGPFLIFWICLFAAFIGALCLGLTFDGKIPGNTATISVFYAFLNTASGLIDTAYISTLFEIFPRNRGPVVCLAKVMTGLGGSLLACISETLFKGSISSFIYFLMGLNVVVAFWASFTVVLPPYYMNWWRRRGKTEEEIAELEATAPYYEHKCVPYPRLIVGYVVVIALLIFFTVQAPVFAYTNNVSRGSEIAVGVIAVVLTLCIFFMLLPLRCLGGIDEPAPSPEEAAAIEGRMTVGSAVDGQMEVRQLDDKGEVTNELNLIQDGSNGVSSPLQKPEVPGSEEAVVAPVRSRQDPRYQGTLMNYLLKLDIWLIMLLFICYGCMGTIVMYNASTISVAIDGKERSSELSALYTAFLGVGSSIGRIAFGLFEAYVQSQDPDNRKIIVTMALPLSPTLACIAGILLLTLPGKAILFPFILVYLEEGVFAGVNALIFPCLFERNHNALYNLSFLVQCISIICFNRLMFGMYVDKKHDEYGFPAGVDCNRKECVQVPLIVATCLAFCGIFVASLIHIRYSRFVRRVREAERRALLNGGAVEQHTPSSNEPIE